MTEWHKFPDKYPDSGRLLVIIINDPREYEDDGDDFNHKPEPLLLFAVWDGITNRFSIKNELDLDLDWFREDRLRYNKNLKYWRYLYLPDKDK